LIVPRLVIGADVAPIATRMTVKAGLQVVRVASLKRSGRGDDLTKREAGRVGGNVGINWQGYPQVLWKN